ncbi:MAG: C39 family peptidase [Planctomycetota bacterium]
MMMTTGMARIDGVLALVAAVGVLGVMACSADAGPSLGADADGDAAVQTDWLRNPLGRVDTRYAWSSADATTNASAKNWSQGESANVRVADTGLRLAPDADRGYPWRGVWTGPVVEPDHPITELLPSWNLTCPPDAGVSFEVRVLMASNDAEPDPGEGAWSPWLDIGVWGRTSPGGPTRFDAGRVLIDVLKLSAPASAFQVRARLESFAPDPNVSATLRKLVVVASGPGEPSSAQLSAPPTPIVRIDESPRAEPAWARDLPVDFRTQQDNAPAIRGRTCSPTSVSMAMDYQGVDLPTGDHAMGIFDDRAGIFGNWGRAVAWASTHGLEAELVRIRDWRQLEACIAAGQPVIASIAFGPGEFPSNVMKQTAGHLILIRGLTADGHAIVNDPASADRGDGVVYQKQELARAWLANGGVAYLITRPNTPGGS